jgi:hypothetical protein
VGIPTAGSGTRTPRRRGPASQPRGSAPRNGSSRRAREQIGTSRSCGTTPLPRRPPSGRALVPAAPQRPSEPGRLYVMESAEDDGRVLLDPNERPAPTGRDRTATQRHTRADARAGLAPGRRSSSAPRQQRDARLASPPSTGFGSGMPNLAVASLPLRGGLRSPGLRRGWLRPLCLNRCREQRRANWCDLNLLIRRARRFRASRGKALSTCWRCRRSASPRGTLLRKGACHPVLSTVFTKRVATHVDHLRWFTVESFGGPVRSEELSRPRGPRPRTTRRATVDGQTRARP